MAPWCVRSPLGPACGPQQAAVPSTFMSMVVRLAANLPGAAPKQAPVVAPTLQEPSLKLMAPVHTATTLPPEKIALSPMVTTYLPSPTTSRWSIGIPLSNFAEHREWMWNTPPVNRRATAEVLWLPRRRSVLPVVVKMLTGLTLTRPQKCLLLALIRVPKKVGPILLHLIGA